MLSLILQALIALPKVFSILREAFVAIRKLQDQRRLEDAKKANNEGDTSELEKKLGASDPGAPSGIPGSVVRNKSGH